MAETAGGRKTLIPSQQIVHVEQGQYWLATGPQPQFLIPCSLHAGWMRICFSIESDVPSTLQVFADFGEGFSEKTCIAKVPVGRDTKHTCLLHLDRPVDTLRIDPITVPGKFRLHEVHVHSIPALYAMASMAIDKLVLMWKHRSLWAALRRGLWLLFSGRSAAFVNKLVNRKVGQPLEARPNYDPQRAYEQWRLRRALTDETRRLLQQRAGTLADGPTFTVVLPINHATEPLLRRAIESVIGQLYPRWELCLCDDGTSPAANRSAADEYVAKDCRLRLVTGADVPINHALDPSRSDYVAFLFPTDLLAEHALYRMALMIASDPTVDVLYSDEDRVDAMGHHSDPLFKPAWSPEYFLELNSGNGLTVCRTKLARELGPFRGTSASVQYFDLFLRAATATTRIAHVPDVLYHRALANDFATEESNMVLARHLAESGQPAAVGPGPMVGTRRVRFTITGKPFVSIIIPTAGAQRTVNGQDQVQVIDCVRSIRQKSTWGSYEILIVADEKMPSDVCEKLSGFGAQILPWQDSFSFSGKINFGASRASGEHLLLLNDDTEAINADWLECMLEYSQQAEIGAVGAKLFFANGRIQHVGVDMLQGIPVHSFYDYPADHVGSGFVNVIPRNCSAVTGACLMTRRRVFGEIGGFDLVFPYLFNDIDYCLKVRQTGRRIVITPYAQLYHYESSTRRGKIEVGRDLFQARWAKAYPWDPYYNPNLSVEYPDFRIDPDGACEPLDTSADSTLHCP